MAKTPETDRRVRKTKQRLNEALNGLMVEKGYDKVTVQDIINRADVGRSTFYAHYETKDDLLMSKIEHLIENMHLALGDAPALSGPVIRCLPLFLHLSENHLIFKSMIGSHGIAMVSELVHAGLLQHVTEILERRNTGGDRHAVPVDARAGFLTGSLLALAQWWLDRDMPYSPEQMDEMFQALTVSA
jgi:AcrR family transcriptional regulator